MTAQEEDNLGLHQSSQPWPPTHVEQPLPTADQQPRDDCTTYCIFSLRWTTSWQKANPANDRALAKMREKIWENGRKTKCRTNYPINAQLSPCGLMVCAGFGNSSSRLRSLLNSLYGVVWSRLKHCLTGCYVTAAVWNTNVHFSVLYFGLRLAEGKTQTAPTQNSTKHFIRIFIICHCRVC